MCRLLMDINRLPVCLSYTHDTQGASFMGMYNKLPLTNLGYKNALKTH